MFGQQAGPKNVGQKSPSCNEPLTHETMLSQVSSLINTRNAKKLAEKGVLQTEHGKCPSKSLMPVSQDEKNNYCVDPSSQETAEKSSLKASQDGKISKRPPEASLERHCDHEQTSTDKLSPKSESKCKEVSSPVISAAVMPSGLTSCPKTSLSTSDSKCSSPILKRVLHSDGFYLDAEVEGVNILFTIDTGATKTIISEKVYNSIPEACRPQLKQSAILSDAAGQPLSQLGTAIFSVKLPSGVNFACEMIVANIEDEGLLGHDLLMEGDAEILYKAGAIQFMGVQIPFKQVEGPSKVRKIRTADHFIIPPNSEMIIDAFIDRWEGDDDLEPMIVLEPSSSVHDRYGLIMAATLSDLKSKVTHSVRLLNPSPEEVSINQDVILGTAESVESVLTLHEMENINHNKLVKSKLNNDSSDSNGTPPKVRKINENHTNTVPEHLHDLFQKACTGRAEEEKQQIAKTLTDFQDTFSKDEFDLGYTNLIEHTIDVGDHKPIKQAPRRVPVAFASEEEKVIKQLEQQGIIRKSTSPWASPICLVKKKSGKIRPCVDYRRLNEITQKDAFPLPRINDCLDSVAGAKLFSTFDLTSGFHQIAIKESDIPKTAFCTKYGLYEYLTMPMGMTNSPAVFQRLMELVLTGLQWHTCLIYLDDVLVFGSNFDEHMQRVEQILLRIREAGLKLKPEKCQFLQTSVNFLGHKISSEGILPNPENIAKVKQWPVPTTATHVRQILGLGSYYRRFIKGYSDLVRPLTLLTHKNKPFIWTEACQISFETLKQKLTSSEIMAYPKDQGLYILDTDASDTQISGVLSQVQDGKERVISYGSRVLNKAEQNYCITDKELLAIRHFAEYYRQYLLGRHFLVRSDHQALTYLFKLKEPKGRIARWIEILSSYDFSIEYRRGTKHANADTLSRCHDPWACQCPESDNLESLKCGPCHKCTKRFNEMQGHKVEQSQSSTETEGFNQTARTVTTRSQSQQNSGRVLSEGQSWSSPTEKSKICNLQDKDPDLSFIINALKLKTRPQHREVVSLSPEARYYWSIWDSLSLVDGCLHRHFHCKDGTGSYLQLVVPKTLRDEILHQVHNSILSGHLGRKKTLQKLLQRFYWFGVKEDVFTWILRCDVCAANKKPYRTPRAPLGKMQVGGTLDRLSTDILGPLPLTPRGNRYILVATDHFSKWVEIMAVPDQSAVTCANKLLNEVISRYGCPLTLHTDRGRNYESSIFIELCKLLEIKKTRTSVRNPRCNGQAERFNRSLLRMIKAYLRGEQENWDLNLGCLAAAYRACPHESTGLSPNLLMLGREVRIPSELVYGGQCNNNREIHSYGEYVQQLKAKMQHAHVIARKHLSTSAKRQKEIYDTKLSVHHYKVGDVVWVENTAVKPGLSPKLQSIYKGPCLIVQKYDSLTYRIQLSKTGVYQVLHHNKLKPYEGNNIPKWLRAARSKLATTNEQSN